MEPLGVEDDGFSALKKLISVRIAMNSFRFAGVYWVPVSKDCALSSMLEK